MPATSRRWKSKKRMSPIVRLNNPAPGPDYPHSRSEIASEQYLFVSGTLSDQIHRPIDVLETVATVEVSSRINRV
jgi:hypothetical protein